MAMLGRLILLATIVGFASLPIRLNAQAAKPAATQDWDKLLEAAKTEGKVTVSIPASAEMRKQLEATFKKR
ncbi:MAG: Extracellular solute-binding protein, partial [Deltaproteobacteria bacterium]|nr:Extracellular solute-binding protein [Deltaproteobacteria bacterium]